MVSWKGYSGDDGQLSGTKAQLFEVDAGSGLSHVGEEFIVNAALREGTQSSPEITALSPTHFVVWEDERLIGQAFEVDDFGTPTEFGEIFIVNESGENLMAGGLAITALSPDRFVESCSGFDSSGVLIQMFGPPAPTAPALLSATIDGGELVLVYNVTTVTLSGNAELQLKGVGDNSVEGAVFKLGQLDEGLSRGEVALEIMHSAEFAQSQDTVQIATLYLALFGRDTDTTGMVYWSEALDTGADVDAVIAALRESTEHHDRFLPNDLG